MNVAIAVAIAIAIAITVAVAIASIDVGIGRASDEEGAKDYSSGCECQAKVGHGSFRDVVQGD